MDVDNGKLSNAEKKKRMLGNRRIRRIQSIQTRCERESEREYKRKQERKHAGNSILKKVVLGGLRGGARSTLTIAVGIAFDEIIENHPVPGTGKKV